MDWLERVRERVGAMGMWWIGIARRALVTWWSSHLPRLPSFV
ncbi:hypothetical protein [Allomeiothermus silvanus]|nr:hypothetical protein [Allomeiothermus silvanus]